ncbi:MAG: HAMP domain-containing histidine kinase [Lachnospiraceae bacterium]|nr:HAMP domain-containing histidine kinase [Lachnospiraceae bacterium]
MYQKIRKQLTFLFTGITSLILVVMSLCYLYMSEKELKKNSFLSFLGEMNTILSNLEQQNIITYEWLSKVSSNGKYLMFIYDNGIPLSYTTSTLSKENLSLMDEVMEYNADTILSVPAPNSFSSSHKEFSYTSSQGEHYYVCYAKIKHTEGNLTAMILFSTKDLLHQFKLSRTRFFIINLMGILVLYLFSWYYTKRLLSPIQKSQEQQAAFIAAASHELRTPLSVILSSISALKCAPPAKQDHFLHTIENESNRMSRLVTDMLTLAQSDNHTWSFHIKETELDTILLNAYEAFQVIAEEKQISLRIELPNRTLPHCFCDPERISQVLEILISNAISYGKIGGYTKLNLTYQNGIFSFYIIDNGIGISKEAKEHIFDRFYRADPSRSKKEHFGLGLCIAKEIVEAHRGSIQVSATSGGGTTFIVKLPLNS